MRMSGAKKHIMKWLFFTSLIALSTAFASCTKSSVANGIPQCIREMIAANKDNPKWEIGKVEEYEFQGQIVYSLNPDYRIITDGASSIVDANCNNICYVGGFAGPDNSLCKGENFFQKAVFRRMVWEKYK